MEAVIVGAVLINTGVTIGAVFLGFRMYKIFKERAAQAELLMNNFQSSMEDWEGRAEKLRRATVDALM
jgi:hypothetical protein